MNWYTDRFTIILISNWMFKYIVLINYWSNILINYIFLYVRDNGMNSLLLCMQIYIHYSLYTESENKLLKTNFHIKRN